MSSHTYELATRWRGNLGRGTDSYDAYSRDFEFQGAGKPTVSGSSDPGFRGDRGRYNPEELLIAALSGCHLLWYLHLCAEAGVVVVEYEDRPSGTITVGRGEADAFTEVVLRPRVEVARMEMADAAASLHEVAGRKCFIANSVNFPVLHDPTISWVQ